MIYMISFLFGIKISKFQSLIKCKIVICFMKNVVVGLIAKGADMDSCDIEALIEVPPMVDMGDFELMGNVFIS